MLPKEQNVITTHHALLIGAGFTPKERREEWPALKGCVQDVRAIKEQLTKSVPGVSIRMLTASLTEPDASSPVEDEGDLSSHSNVMSSLEMITLQAAPSTFVYIHFTGHGTAIAPTSKFSSNSTGELALVLIAGGDATKIQYLRGSELAFWLKKMVDKGLKVTLVLDCCASGSVVRDEKDPSVRYLPYDSTVDAAYPPTPGQSLSLEDEATLPPFRGASMRSNWLVSPDGYTVLTACGPAEVARELQVGQQWYGVLSYFLARAFINCGRVGGRQQHIYAHLCARFREKGVRQTPMLYGNKRLCFFEDANREDDAIPISIMKNMDQNLQLGAGQAQGVCQGDKFALCSINPRKRDSEQNSVLFEVIRSGALMSDLNILGMAVVQSGMTATACTRLSLRRFPILLDLQLPCRDIWERARQERPSLDVQYSDNAEPGVSFSFHVTISARDSYEIQDELKQRIPDLPASQYDLQENAGYVLDIVEHLAKFKLVENLANGLLANPAHPFRKSFSVHLVNAAKKIFYPGCSKLGPFHPTCAHAECLVEVEDGDELTLVVQNKEEKGGRDIYFYFYNMGSCWEIENLLHGNHYVIPPRSSNKDDKDFENGTSGEWKQSIQNIVPREIKDKGKQNCDDIFKIFLTVQPTSFTLLELPEIGELTKRHGSSEGRGSSPAFDSEDWAALSFRVRTYVK
ncbi:hypothetical protein BP5796_04434 [Coleophoma crateriformis]|uniref:Peptidase C14 caspase domain-containing protein n=1 Tax=Coleophoma crateriformis TaxID=565419 RepID=A0A3D8S9J6_9HELO|nr:hypothetical protein BP5796_04434 [Coleophoma crateriformis]